ncbi:unnamed protein product [Blepharisma stoltei]|uniref:Uncharacterized protein n=1 Tax=Blepharisma stoltei TaxID=1481888 RepID=A0AAU9IMU1_9CILI|nr:unnamed protein product [Blepharisma stoltei]
MSSKTPYHRYSNSNPSKLPKSLNSTCVSEKQIPKLKLFSTDSSQNSSFQPNFAFQTFTSKPRHKRTISGINSIVCEFNSPSPKNNWNLNIASANKINPHKGFSKCAEVLKLSPDQPDTYESTASEEEFREIKRISSLNLDSPSKNTPNDSCNELANEMAIIKASQEFLLCHNNNKRVGVKQKMLEILNSRKNEIEIKRYKFRLQIVKEIHKEEWDKKLIIAFRENDEKDFGVFCNESGTLLKITEGRRFPERLLVSQMKMAYYFDVNENRLVQCAPSKSVDAVVLI